MKKPSAVPSSVVAAAVPPSAVVPAPVDSTLSQDIGALVPVFYAWLGDEMVKSQVVNARDLHQFMDSRQQFSHWIKSRIADYEFIQDIDYIAIDNPDYSPPRKEYHISLGMAKELAMVERTKQGRLVRRYFIECERKLISELHRDRPLAKRIPYGHTTRPLIQSRSQLSFRTIDPQTGEAVSSLENSAATWDVPHDLSEVKAEKLGQTYFAELLELNEQNPEEAHKALLEVFLFGWRTPLACNPVKTETKFIKGLDKAVQVATLDSWVNPDLIARHSLERGFLKAMISRTLQS